MMWWPSAIFGILLRGFYTPSVGLQPWPYLPYVLLGSLLFGVIVLNLDCCLLSSIRSRQDILHPQEDDARISQLFRADEQGSYREAQRGVLDLLQPSSQPPQS